MNFEKILQELRQMREQPTHRFYALVALVVLELMRRPLTTILISTLAVWFGAKQGG